MQRLKTETGAVAVEFALLLPVLLLILLGIIEFGRAFNTQITLTQAAREGVRVMAIDRDDNAVDLTVFRAAVSLDPTLMRIGVLARSTTSTFPATPATTCNSGDEVTVRIDYELPSLTGFLGPLNIAGLGVMQCGG
jgi:Flp pilus assembly protein TadG